MNYKVCTNNYMLTTKDGKIHKITVEAYEFNYAYKITKDDIKNFTDVDKFIYKENAYVSSNGVLYFEDIDSAYRAIDIISNTQEVSYGIQTRHIY